MHRMVITALLLITATGTLQAGASLGLQNPQQPERFDLPATAIDTQQIPKMKLDPDAADDKPLPYYRIAPNTYMLFGNIAEVDGDNRGWNGNAGFVVTDSGVVVIDALGTPKLGNRFIATIRQVSDKPIKYLIQTHNHPDHSYGTIAFRRNTDAEIIAHQGTLNYIYSQQLDSSVEFRRGFIEEDMEGFKAVEPDHLIDVALYEKERFSVGGHSFDIYNVDSHHSYGDLVIHQMPENIVWISDLAFNQRTTYMGDGDSKMAIKSQNWLLETFADATLMVPGHGSAQTSPFPMVTETRNYMQRLREKMGEAIDEGVGLHDAVDNADLEDWEDVRLYDLNHRPNANFVYREMELELF